MAATAAVHPSDQTLQSHGLGKLDDLQAEEVSKHMEECEACRSRVAEVTSDSFVGRLRDAQGRPESVAPIGSSLAGLSKLGGESRTRSPPPASTLPPGLAEHPDYQVLRELGRGGMGVVYLAENRMMGRKEVLKVVGSHLLNRKGVLERFLREIRSAAQLHHPNIVTAYSATRVGESIVFSMQYVDGYDLSKLVDKSGPLSVAHACNFVYQAALGLQHAHEHGMVHRDIKPSNLMLARDGNKPVVKVLDFGLAKVTSERAVDGGLTSEGQLLGTPHYVAPEQTVNAQKAAIRADIYSLGCTLYCLLTGHPPFDAPSLYELLQAHHLMDAKPLNFIRPEVPAELAAVVAKMLAKEPERRFQTPGEVAEALKPFFRKHGVNSKALKPEVSQVGLVDPKQEPAEVRTPAPQPKANVNPASARAVAGSRTEPMWESLIEIKETEDAEDVVAAVSQPKRRWPRWFWPAIAGAFSFAMIALGVIIYVTTDYGRIKIIVDGPKADVRVDGEQILIKTPRESITLRAGTHELAVKWGDGEFKTCTFVVRRGGNEELRVEYEPKHSPDKPPAPPVESINRTITDSMLVIKTNNRNIMDNAKENFPVQVDPNIRATLRSEKIYINEMFGRENVLCTEPLSPSSPGTMDFSRITKDRTGSLTLLVHGYPAGVSGGRIVVKSDGVMVNDATVRFRDGWKKIVVPFRRNEIVVEHHALGWNMEFLFVDYWIVGEHPAAKTPPAPSDNAKAWSRLMAKPGRQSIGPAPYACWTFESDARDEIGSMHGTLLGGAAVREGRLYLGGDPACMRTPPLSRDIREKTLEAWVLLDNLDQRGGDVISIEYGSTFDAIVFGDPESKKWIAGSEWFRRTATLGNAVENAKFTDLIHMAIVYDLEGGITVYREGKRYAEKYVPGGDQATLRTYPAGKSHVLLGHRATGKGAGFLVGAIEEARLYDRALTADEVAASYRAGVIHYTTPIGVEKVSGTAPGVPRSIEGKPPAPPAVSAVDSPAPTPAGKPPVPQAAKAVEPGKPIPPGPFRVATNGLAGRQFIDPVTFGPDWLGFNEPGTAFPWAAKDAFARLTTKAALGYPRLPVSRYVCEVELTVHRRGQMMFYLGDPWNASALNFLWNPKREMTECLVSERRHDGGWFWGGSRDFAPERRISLKLVVGDGVQTLIHEHNPISWAQCWPTDCCLRIWSETPDSAVIHRCSLRPLTEQDVAACGWTTPPTDLALNAGDAAARLAKISEGYPDRPKGRKNFAVKTTGTPMAWIPPGEFVMGNRNAKDPVYDGRHRVRLTRGYWMAQVEVTQGEFSKVTGANPSRVTGSPYLPVDWVAWDQAAAYCWKLTNLERKKGRLPREYEYRLPTEAEWEYASRAGSDEDFSVPVKQVWSRETSGCRPHEVAASQPNQWGLYDMHGNAMEWCFDAWYGYPTGEKEVTVDPFKIGQPDKDSSVVRGGAWWSAPPMCASHWRSWNRNNPNSFRGFRIVLGPAISLPEQ